MVPHHQASQGEFLSPRLSGIPEMFTFLRTRPDTEDEPGTGRRAEPIRRRGSSWERALVEKCSENITQVSPGERVRARGAVPFN